MTQQPSDSTLLQHFGGSRGDLPEGLHFKHRITRVTGGERHRITAHVPEERGEHIGELSWYGRNGGSNITGTGQYKPGEISWVNVHPRYEGRGIASSMLEHAQQLHDAGHIDTLPIHSDDRTDDGDHWVNKVSEGDDDYKNYPHSDPDAAYGYATKFRPRLRQSDMEKVSILQHFAAPHPITQQDWFHAGHADERSLSSDKRKDEWLHVGTQDAALQRVDPHQWVQDPSKRKEDRPDDHGWDTQHKRLKRVRVVPGATVCPTMHTDDQGCKDCQVGNHYPDSHPSHDDFDEQYHCGGKFDVHRYTNNAEDKGSMSLIVRPSKVRVVEDMGRHPAWSQAPEAKSAARKPVRRDPLTGIELCNKKVDGFPCKHMLGHAQGCDVDWNAAYPDEPETKKESSKDPCPACSGSGEQGTGHECYKCDGSGALSAYDDSIDNAHPENGLLVGRDDAKGIKPVVAGVRTFWHGSPSGDMRGGAGGLHVGTQEAARQALHARIGFRADGRDWDGSSEYGSTLLAGKKNLLARERGHYLLTGHNSRDLPEEDHYAKDRSRRPVFGDGDTEVSDSHKPDLFPVKIVGPMSNRISSPHEDFHANGMMRGQIKRGTAKSGYYYTNAGEDSGSISAVLPGPSHVERVSSKTAHVLDTWQPTDRLFAPTNGSLDPRLFDGDKIRPEVRDFVLGRLAAWWDGRYADWRTWSKVYIAGSSISEWWADKDQIQSTAGANGDLPDNWRVEHHLNEEQDSYSGDGSRFRHGTVHGFVGDEPVGRIAYTLHDEPKHGYDKTLRINMMSVLPEQQRKGAATSMMSALEERHPDARILHGNRTHEGDGWAQSYYGDKKGRTRSGRTGAHSVDPKYRLNDDLDTLIGVEYKGLVAANPQFAGMSPKMVSAHLNAELREHCNLEDVYLHVPAKDVPEWEWADDPHGDTVMVGPWSSTFYVNPNSYDIRAIKPYAAYNLSDDEWAVRPVSEPTGHQFGPTEWYYFEGVAQQVKGALALPEPARTNRCKRIWEHIHSSRSGAFGPHGQGVFDYRNAVEKFLTQHPGHLWDRLVEARFGPQSSNTVEPANIATHGSKDASEVPDLRADQGTGGVRPEASSVPGVYSPGGFSPMPNLQAGEGRGPLRAEGVPLSPVRQSAADGASQGAGYRPNSTQVQAVPADQADLRVQGRVVQAVHSPVLQGPSGQRSREEGSIKQAPAQLVLDQDLRHHFGSVRSDAGSAGGDLRDLPGNAGGFGPREPLRGSQPQDGAAESAPVRPMQSVGSGSGGRSGVRREGDGVRAEARAVDLDQAGLWQQLVDARFPGQKTAAMAWAESTWEDHPVNRYLSHTELAKLPAGDYDDTPMHSAMHGFDDDHAAGAEYAHPGDLAHGSPRAYIDHLKKDIAERGMKRPICIHNGEVVNGHHRGVAAIELGMDRIPVHWDEGRQGHAGEPKTAQIVNTLSPSMTHNTSGATSRKPSMTLCNDHHRVLRGLQVRYNNTDGMDPDGWSFSLRNEGTKDGTCDMCTKEAVDDIFNKTSSRGDPTTLHPNMNHYRDGGMGGVGENHSVVGYVRTDALRKMHGNETDSPGVERHRESLRNGEGFTDPAMVVFDPRTHNAYLGEGNHRVQAAHEEGISHVPVRVVRGSVSNSGAQHMEHAKTPYKGNLGEDYWPSDIHPSHIFGPDEVLDQSPKEGVPYDHDEPGEGRRTGGRGRPNRRPVPGGDAGSGSDPGDSADARPGVRTPAARPLTYHPRVLSKDLKKMSNRDKSGIEDTLDALARGDENVQTHKLSEGLPGWYATKASRGHRITHQPDGNGGIYIGHIGLHNYQDAINRLAGVNQDALGTTSTRRSPRLAHLRSMEGSDV